MRPHSCSCPNPPLRRLNRIEALEVKLTQLNAGRSLVPVQRELETVSLGGCVLLRDRTDPGSPYYNRIKGFGPDSLPFLDQLLGHYPDAAPCFDLTPNRLTENVSRALCERDYIPAEQTAFLYAHPSAEADTDTAFPIERITEDSAEEFIDWIRQSGGASELTGEIVARSKEYFYRPDFINYTIRIDGNPAAMGSLFVNGQEGYIANDYTFEPYRGRGCQQALLKLRLADAVRLGVETVCTDVAFGSASHGNMERAGFRLSFINTLWMKK